MPRTTAFAVDVEFDDTLEVRIRLRGEVVQHAQEALLHHRALFFLIRQQKRASVKAFQEERSRDPLAVNLNLAIRGQDVRIISSFHPALVRRVVRECLFPGDFGFVACLADLSFH